MFSSKSGTKSQLKNPFVCDISNITDDVISDDVTVSITEQRGKSETEARQFLEYHFNSKGEVMTLDKKMNAGHPVLIRISSISDEEVWHQEVTLESSLDDIPRTRMDNKGKKTRGHLEKMEKTLLGSKSKSKEDLKVESIALSPSDTRIVKRCSSNSSDSSSSVSSMHSLSSYSTESTQNHFKSDHISRKPLNAPIIPNVRSLPTFSTFLPGSGGDMTRVKTDPLANLETCSSLSPQNRNIQDPKTLKRKKIIKSPVKLKKVEDMINDVYVSKTYSLTEV